MADQVDHEGQERRAAQPTLRHQQPDVIQVTGMLTVQCRHQLAGVQLGQDRRLREAKRACTAGVV